MHRAQDETPYRFFDLPPRQWLLSANLLLRTIVERLVSKTGGKIVRLCQRDKHTRFILMVYCGAYIIWSNSWPACLVMVLARPGVVYTQVDLSILSLTRYIRGGYRLSLCLQ